MQYTKCFNARTMLVFILFDIKSEKQWGRGFIFIFGVKVQNLNNK